MLKQGLKPYQSREEYQAHFNTDTFLRSNTVDDAHKCLGDLWLNLFASGALRGHRLLDFGCGPCINLAAPASRFFDEIYLADYLPQNRQAVQDWIDLKPSAHDWNYYLKLVAESEGGNIPWEAIADRVRGKITQVLPCDAFNVENPFHPNDFAAGYFDCVLDNLCTYAICTDNEHYKNIIQRLGTYVKPGGFIALGVVAMDTFYPVGDTIFHALPFQRDEIEEILKAGGFVNTEYKTKTFPKSPQSSSDDVHECMVVTGEKSRHL